MLVSQKFDRLYSKVAEVRARALLQSPHRSAFQLWSVIVFIDETLLYPALLNQELISHFYDQLYVPTAVALTYWLRSKYFDDMTSPLIILLAILKHT